MKRRLVVMVACFSFVVPLSGQQLQRNEAEGVGPHLEQAKAGKQRFFQACSACHGTNGEGGQGPKLVNNWSVRSASKQTLFGYIRNGVPGSAMPPFSLPDNQIWELVAFVRSLNDPAISFPVPGDVEAGKAIFFGKGDCTNCHMIRGQGGFLGPDLSEIGAMRRIDQLRSALLKPNDHVSEDFRAVTFTMSDGRSIEGVAKHYSNYSMAVLDKNGVLHLLRDGDMRRIVFREKSWMPDDYAQRLTPMEVENVLAFLSQQSIRPPTEPETAPASVGPEREPEPRNPDPIARSAVSFRSPSAGVRR